MNNRHEREPEFLRPEELAELLRVSLKWVRTHSHRISGYTKIGHAVRYRRSSVMTSLAGGKVLKD